ncbi:MAG: cystathionine beta-lyase [Hyphomonadaceae bacterium]|nr:cystathionine beta-lyase [Hyphomonadaceae bacterium]
MTQHKPSTRLIHTRGSRLEPSSVNPPIERASTVLFPDPGTLYTHKPGYGRMGLTVHRELEAALATLEHAEHVRLTMNGLAACALAIGSVLDVGDHALIQDSLYGPTRRFCERRLKAMGITVTRFPTRIDASTLMALVQPNTKALVLESPGSLTFDLPDTQMMVGIAAERGLVTIADNTWGAGLYHKPLDLGVDISVQALTKYAVGHADAFGGAVMTRRQDLASRIVACSEDWGIALGPEEAYAALRGLRTLDARLTRHQANGLALAEWLATRPEVARVIHPARPDHPDHALWKRDFTGACGLFGAVLNPVPEDRLNDMLSAVKLFGLGFSWGGYESLIIPCDAQLNRTFTPEPQLEGPLLRIHAGLEAIEDLQADLAQAFARLT